MWDEMVTTIIIKKVNKMETIFKSTQADVEGSFVIRTFRKRKKEATMEEEREKMIDKLIMKKNSMALTRQNASMWMN